MKNKFPLLITLAALFLILSIGTMIYLAHNNPKVLSPLANNGKKQDNLQGSATDKEFFDPSGFKFKYPDGLTVNSKQITDNSIYSQIEILSATNSGLITILAKSSNLNTIDDYFKQNKDIKTSEIKNLNLAGDDARQFQHNQQLITIALDQGVLFTITTDLKDKPDYWQKINKTLVDSFTFVQPSSSVNTTSSGSSDQSSGDVIDEGEEVVQ